MLVRNSSKKLVGAVSIIETNSNKDATKYVEAEYNNLIKYIYTLGIKDKAEDLLNDVWVSLHKAECDGEGYNEEYIKGGHITVEQFVLKRIAGYAKSDKYKNYVSEVGKYTVCGKEVEEQMVLGMDGKPEMDKQGRVVYKRTERTVKRTYKCNTFVASFDGGEQDDEFQRAYQRAEYFAEFNEVEERLQLLENINICIDICDLYNIKVINIFKNIDRIACTLGNTKGKRKGAESAFEELAHAVEMNDELGEALRSVLEFSSKRRDIFESVLQMVPA